MQIPERLVNFRCYGGGGAIELIGLTDIELPKFESMTETVMGAGIAGEYDSPVIGHFKSQQVKLKWRSVTTTGLALLAAVQQSLQLRGSIQVQDPALGLISTVPLYVDVRGQTKTFGLGKMEPGKPMETESEIEVAKITISLAGVPLVEFDKFNQRYIVAGIDYLQSMRVDTGGV